MDGHLLVLNAGSSSIKFQVFETETGALTRLLRGQVEGIGTAPRLLARDGDGAPLVDEAHSPDAVGDPDAAIALLGGFLESALAGKPLSAVGHRVVHGGPRFDRPALLDHDILTALEGYVPLAPLHQPANLASIRAIQQRFPEVPQVACFDTAFHRDHGELADRFAVPQWLYEEGVRRYGFHGLSYEFVARRLREIEPDLAGGRIVVAHLGSGASLCALRGGHSVESTMGFTALDGLPMGTRPGQLDPGVVLYLFAEKSLSAAEVQQLLYYDCGLKALSGTSNDVRDLLGSEDPRARFALDYFAYRIAKEIGALATVLGGLDALVFTAGIGENAPEIRAMICGRLGLFGIELDEGRNARHALRVETSGPVVFVLPTDEEWMIAEHTLAVLDKQTRSKPG